MNLDDKILIPICKNHFERLAKNDVCIACPSKLENKEILEAIADLYKEDKDKDIFGSLIKHIWIVENYFNKKVYTYKINKYILELNDFPTMRYYLKQAKEYK